MKLVRKISPLQTYLLRLKVLRPGQGLSSVLFHGDFAKNSFHMGVFENSSPFAEPVGVASFVQEPRPEALTKVQLKSSQAKQDWRLRGMAVSPRVHRRGFGAELLRLSEVELRDQCADLLWFNARINAIKFYESLGYLGVGDLFMIEGVCEHLLMFKVFLPKS